MHKLIFDRFVGFVFSCVHFCRLRLRWEGIEQAKQSLPELHVIRPMPAEQQWIAVVFWVALCFLFNFLPFWGRDRTGRFLCHVPWLLSPDPVRQEGLLGLQPMQMAVLQGAHFLQESSAGNAENQLENQVLHKASSLEPVLQKEVRRSSAVWAAAPTQFSKQGTAGGAVLGIPCKTYE